ncbi:MAG: NAD(P)/FAD-dependent oxidoreductase, partial [Acidobacteria bacterium]|nr:NAD(P)/FAD-dependent oxidoreductase [Acidobacteriota bacterium]
MQYSDPPTAQPSSTQNDAPVVILGAGPAGLTAAYELSSKGIPSVLLEKETLVGGLSRTLEHNGYLFDIGGHRFYTKLTMVEKIWREILGEDLLERPRLSRIFYRSRFFQYPLEISNVVSGLGLLECARCGLSFLKAKLFPQRPEPDFETWVSNRFGRRLFNVFFRTYTEKVWGIPCNKIKAEWAAQRIRGLSVTAILKSALKRRSAGGGEQVRTLIREFLYPRKGPGMMWARMNEIVESRGCRTELGANVEKILWKPGRIEAVVAGGRTYRAEHFVSSMPIRELIEKLDPAPPEWLRGAVDDFHYRDFLTVALILKGENLFPDNWIYVHDPGVAVGRIQNYGNWSPEMVPEPGMSCLGLEYFCFEGDGLWTAPDDDLIRRAISEVGRLGLAREDSFVDGAVLRIPKAYPVYDDTYQRGLDATKRFLAEVGNLQLIGRNGMHRYNNQDHSMLMGMLAARNIMGARFDLWSLNIDSEHVEEGREITEADIAAMEST